MKESLRKWNKKLEGFRGIITLIGTYLSIYASSFFDSITGVSPNALKGAAIMAIPVTLKLVWTDVRPRLLKALGEWISGGKGDDNAKGN